MKAAVLTPEIDFKAIAKQFAEAVTTELRSFFDRPAPALLSAEQVASILGISERQVWRLHSEGKLPPPKKLDGMKLTKWRRTDIYAYVEN